MSQPQERPAVAAVPDDDQLRRERAARARQRDVDQQMTRRSPAMEPHQLIIWGRVELEDDLADQVVDTINSTIPGAIARTRPRDPLWDPSETGVMGDIYYSPTARERVLTEIPPMAGVRRFSAGSI